MFYVALLLTPLQLDNVRFVIGYLVLLNVGLAGFNLLSAFPMGGGRLLRALLAQSHSYPVATQAATEVGKVVAVILGGVGVLLPNIWVIVIVIFVYIGAVNTTRQTVLAWAFQTVEVPDLMAAANMEAIPPVLSADLLKRMVQNRHTTYPVLESGRLNGMVRLEHITSIQSSDRNAASVEEIMTTDPEGVRPDRNHAAATGIMQRNNIDAYQLLTRKGGSLVSFPRLM